MMLDTTATPCHAQASHPPTLAPRGAGSLVGATGALALAALLVALALRLGLGLGLGVDAPGIHVLDAGVVDGGAGGAP